MHLAVFTYVGETVEKPLLYYQYRLVVEHRLGGSRRLYKGFEAAIVSDYDAQVKHDTLRVTSRDRLGSLPPPDDRRG